MKEWSSGRACNLHPTVKSGSSCFPWAGVSPIWWPCPHPPSLPHHSFSPSPANMRSKFTMPRWHRPAKSQEYYYHHSKKAQLYHEKNPLYSWTGNQPDGGRTGEAGEASWAGALSRGHPSQKEKLNFSEKRGDPLRSLLDAIRVPWQRILIIIFKELWSSLLYAPSLVFQ